MGRDQPRHDVPGPHKDLWGAAERPSKASQARFGAALLRSMFGDRGGDAEPQPARPDAPVSNSGGAAATPD
jgi:hypothetical protein